MRFSPAADKPKTTPKLSPIGLVIVAKTNLDIREMLVVSEALAKIVEIERDGARLTFSPLYGFGYRDGLKCLIINGQAWITLGRLIGILAAIVVLGSFDDGIDLLPPIRSSSLVDDIPKHLIEIPMASESDNGRKPPLFGRDPGLPACLKADLRLRITASQKLSVSNRPNCGHEMCRITIVKLPGFGRSAAES
ncbi:hypothetical protein [Novosphingobium sp. B1]|uniref:hypothetical protein n=1 Tax=Novosphingobium sp. B1 TaxID=1938756 RepID=UPI001594763D|nr:hypothetical protein [Novosphingobium sp. B1]